MPLRFTVKKRPHVYEGFPWLVYVNGVLSAATTDADAAYRWISGRLRDIAVTRHRDGLIA